MHPSLFSSSFTFSAVTSSTHTLEDGQQKNISFSDSAVFTNNELKTVGQKDIVNKLMTNVSSQRGKLWIAVIIL